MTIKLCKRSKKDRSSQASISINSCTELSKTHFFLRSLWSFTWVSWGYLPSTDISCRPHFRRFLPSFLCCYLFSKCNIHFFILIFPSLLSSTFILCLSSILFPLLFFLSFCAFVCVFCCCYYYYCCYHFYLPVLLFCIFYLFFNPGL